MKQTLAHRIASIGLSAVLTLAMLAGVDFLAQPDSQSAQWAQQTPGAVPAVRG